MNAFFTLAGMESVPCTWGPLVADRTKKKPTTPKPITMTPATTAGWTLILILSS
jgi:hypothetical protein